MTGTEAVIEAEIGAGIEPGDRTETGRIMIEVVMATDRGIRDVALDAGSVETQDIFVLGALVGRHSREPRVRAVDRMREFRAGVGAN